MNANLEKVRDSVLRRFTEDGKPVVFWHDPEREFAEDPAFRPDDDVGWGKARLAFRPFLVLAILEYMLLGEGLIWDTLLHDLVFL